MLSMTFCTSYLSVSFKVYLKTDPETCLKRIRARNRPEEASIDLHYLTELHQRHEDWLVNETCRAAPLPLVCIIDANQDKSKVYADTIAHI